MLNHNRLFIASAGLGASVILATIFLSGCSSAKPATTAAGTQPASSTWIIGQESGETGVQLWAENCNRCHNIRPPNEYSRAQWDVIMHHMRVRASLTAEEARKITEFIKAAD